MENNITPQNRTIGELPQEWQRFMVLCDRMKFGDLSVSIVNGKPVLVKNLQQNIKLDQPDDFTVKLL